MDGFSVLGEPLGYVDTSTQEVEWNTPYAEKRSFLGCICYSKSANHVTSHYSCFASFSGQTWGNPGNHENNFECEIDNM